MIPPDALLGTSPFRHLGVLHPRIAHVLASLVLLIPGYAIELGFYFIVLLIFLIPAWRGRSRLTDGQRTLVVLVLATLPIPSFLRSAILDVNDFGMHSALFFQIPLVLLASELVMSWHFEKQRAGLAPRCTQACLTQLLAGSARSPNLQSSLESPARDIRLSSFGLRYPSSRPICRQQGTGRFRSFRGKRISRTRDTRH